MECDVLEFEKVNSTMLLGMAGLIAIALSLVYTRQDGTLLKICLVLLGISMGLPLSLPDFLKASKKE